MAKKDNIETLSEEKFKKIRDEAYLERSADGNIGLGEFADILVEIAK